MTAATLTTAALAAQRSEREIIGRLNDVLDTLGTAISRTPRSVLAKMRGLSGAHFIAGGEDGRVTETSLPAPSESPVVAPIHFAGDHVDSLAESPAILLDGTPYFAVSVRSPSSAAGRLAHGALPRDQLASGEVGGGDAVSLARDWLARSDGPRDKLDRPPHQRADPTGCEGRWPRIAAGDFHDLELGGRHDEVADLTALDQPDVRSTEGECGRRSTSPSGPGCWPSSPPDWPISFATRSPGPG